MKIVVTEELDLNETQLNRLKALGEVTAFADQAAKPEDWLDRVQGFDVICSSKYGLKQNFSELKNVFVSVPVVSLNWLDTGVLKQNNVQVANAPGGNKDAVSEWIIGMMIQLVRKFPDYTNNAGIIAVPRLPRMDGISAATVCVLGAGNIGSQAGRVCEAMNMNVKYFRRGDDLQEKVKDADVIINTLSLNDDSRGILDAEFFKAVKRGAYFISVAERSIMDEAALFAALDDGTLAGVAVGCGVKADGGDNPDYETMMQHPNILATPSYVASNTFQAAQVANDIMIENIEAYVNGKPQNLIV
jgi:phosphoglycerate dehydrogenase-like enzyme